MSRNQYLALKGTTPDMNTFAPLGTRIPIKLDNRMQNVRLRVRLNANLRTTVNPTAIRNRGLLSAALQFAVNENGVDTYGIAEGKALRFKSDAEAGQPTPATPVSAAMIAAPGTYPIEDVFYINFANPLSVRMRETNFMELDPSQTLQLDCVLKPGAVGFVVTGGTAFLENVFVRVEQDATPDERGLPLFKPKYREISDVVAGANAEFIQYIRSSLKLRGLIVMQEANVVGEVADIINSLTLVGDGGKVVIGPAFVPWADLIDEQTTHFGGDVIANESALFLDFQRHGRLSDVLDPSRQFVNFRLVSNVQPTAAAGAGTSRIRLGLLELDRPAAQTGWKAVEDESALPDWAR